MADPTSEFDQYRDDILAALGDREPLAVLRATFDEVRQLTAAVAADRLRRAPAAGEWSPWQVLSHFADNDLVWGVRVRMVVTQDRPPLVPYDQEAWTARFGDLDIDPGDTLARWQALRLSNLRLWDSLSADEWQRTGLHPERGELAVRTIVELLAGHDRIHLEQMLRGLA